MDDGGEGQDSDDGDDSNDGDGNGDSDTGALPLPPGECVDDCTVPAESQWSRVVPTDTARTWACDVAVDASGRVALAWRIEGTDEFPQGRSGIDLMNPDGSLAESTMVEGQTFTSLAFASDGTLRARGVTLQGGGDAQWVTALDDTLTPTWSVDYPEVGGNGQCDWGWTGVLVDATDHLVTYDYTPNGPTRSFIRRHAPDGTVLWEATADGNPGFLRMPIAVGADQSVYYGEQFLYDASAETVVHKYSSDGELLWEEVIPDEVDGIWAAPDGGAYVQTVWFPSEEGFVHRLGPDGTYLSAHARPNEFFRTIGAAADGSGFFAVDDGALVRTDPQLNTIWTADIPHADGLIFASAVASDEQRFAFGSSNTDDDSNYWVSVLAKP
jgi:hypothetical protein